MQCSLHPHAISTVNIHTSLLCIFTATRQREKASAAKKSVEGEGERDFGEQSGEGCNSLQLCTLWLYTTFQLLSRSKIVKNRISTFLLLLHRRAIPKCIFPIIFSLFFFFLLPRREKRKKITRSTSNFFPFINHHDYYYISSKILKKSLRSFCYVRKKERKKHGRCNCELTWTFIRLSRLQSKDRIFSQNLICVLWQWEINQYESANGKTFYH